jgi:hypothetical protein
MASASWIMVHEKHCREGTSFSAKNWSFKLGESNLAWETLYSHLLTNIMNMVVT